MGRHRPSFRPLELTERLSARAEAPLPGVSNLTGPQLRRVLARRVDAGQHPFRVVPNNHNFAVRDDDPDLRNLCAAAAIAVVNYSPSTPASWRRSMPAPERKDRQNLAPTLERGLV